jgi:hypothetical protein
MLRHESILILLSLVFLRIARGTIFKRIFYWYKMDVNMFYECCDYVYDLRVMRRKKEGSKLTA